MKLTIKLQYVIFVSCGDSAHSNIYNHINIRTHQIDLFNPEKWLECFSNTSVI